MAKLDTRKARCRFPQCEVQQIVARLDISGRCADNVRKSAGKSKSPRAAVARVLAKAARPVEAETSAIVVDRSIALVETKVAVLSGKRGHLSQVCRSSGGERECTGCRGWNPLSLGRREIKHLWALSFCGHFWNPVRRIWKPVEHDHGLWVLRNTWCRWQNGKVWVSHC